MSQFTKPTPGVPVIRSAYDGSRVRPFPEVGTESRTKQSFKESTDVNSVLARYARTGVWSRSPRVPMFGDVSFVEDYHSALNRVMEAEQDVRRLPVKAREAYDADPEGFLSSVMAARDRAALEALGLVEPVPLAAAEAAVAQ